MIWTLRLNNGTLHGLAGIDRFQSGGRARWLRPGEPPFGASEGHTEKDLFCLALSQLKVNCAYPGCDRAG